MASLIREDSIQSLVALCLKKQAPNRSDIFDDAEIAFRSINRILPSWYTCVLNFTLQKNPFHYNFIIVSQQDIPEICGSEMWGEVGGAGGNRCC